MAHTQYCSDHIVRDESTDDEQHYRYAAELCLSPVLPMVLRAAVELQVLDIIAKVGPEAQLSPAQIASQLPANTLVRNPDAPETLDRMLRLLASHSILTCSIANEDCASPNGAPAGGTRLYGLAPVAKFFVPNKDGVSFAPMLFLNTAKTFTSTWYDLKDVVLEGGMPFDRLHGTQAFEHLGKDTKFNEVFNKAMMNRTIIDVNKLLQSSYKGFEQLEKLVDVGGGLGVTLNLITTKYPRIKGVNFDLPHVIQHAPPYPGVEHVEGDMFESVPKGDAIFMKEILHNWNDDHCLKLLQNCHKALPDDGKIIVVEGILQMMPDNNAKDILAVDLIMMVQLSGGKERTQQEFLALATGAGFSGIRLECVFYNTSIMEFYK